MPRNRNFVPAHEPLRADESLDIIDQHTSGPFSFFNPTRARYDHKAFTTPSPNSSVFADTGTYIDEEKVPPPPQNNHTLSDIHFQWRSRDNRKGRHALVVSLPSSGHPSDTQRINSPESTSTLRSTGKGILRMATQFPYWNISYLVATIFTLGSIVWVFNAFFVWLPLVKPSTEFPTEIVQGGGITAFIGATIFEIGSVLLMFEAVNESRAGCFGWAVEQVWEGLEGEGEKKKGKMMKLRLMEDEKGCAHHHTNRKNLVGKGDNVSSSPSPASDPQTPSKAWRWFPSTTDLRTHYLHDLGFLASFSQFLGATIFWISGFTALPGINNKLSQGLLDGIYWAPQIIGGTGFIISGTLFMIETQSKFYIPAPKVLGWHIGLWNLIGALGFTASGALGPAFGSSRAQYEAALSTFWGSWAFLIGSVIQWYECLDQHPVEESGKE